MSIAYCRNNAANTAFGMGTCVFAVCCRSERRGHHCECVHMHRKYAHANACADRFSFECIRTLPIPGQNAECGWHTRHKTQATQVGWEKQWDNAHSACSSTPMAQVICKRFANSTTTFTTSCAEPDSRKRARTLHTRRCHRMLSVPKNRNSVAARRLPHPRVGIRLLLRPPAMAHR